MFERFTDRARRVLVLAQEEARLLNHPHIGTEHILLGLIHEGDGLAAKVLESLDISLDAVREKVEEMIGPSGSAPTALPPFTPRAKKVLELSLREALQLGHNYIGTEHMLLGLVREGDGVAAQVLVSLGADLPRVREGVLKLVRGYQGRSEGRPGGIFGQQMPRGSSFAHVGKGWTADVVRKGRRPDAYAKAYRELGELVAAQGWVLDDFDASEISVQSVETDEGPGLRISVEHRVEAERPGEPEEPDLPSA